MSGFDQILSTYALLLFVWVAVVAYAILLALGERSQPSIMPTIGIAIAGFPIALAVSTATVAILAAIYQPAAFANAIVKSPLDFTAYLVETGLEFALLSIISVAMFIFTRLRKRHLTRLST
ncbi:hypothetical protein IVB14_17695 [Bradyrhizobium sp. 180]|uniref:hypothetical protein n=1 Tax=Bradyrhizobium sp. 180 TaxID=2782650 RepID=UPI001FF81EBE|nr:hypothetical protein [Bradyrhizobium sp. 180]MCK1492205.1 hypothetical protein [Bradyrhizobium sp. 180]